MTCRFCSKIGHIDKVCMSKARQLNVQSRPAPRNSDRRINPRSNNFAQHNFVQDTECSSVSHSSVDDNLYTLYNVDSISDAPKPVRIQLLIQGLLCSFEVDSLPYQRKDF